RQGKPFSLALIRINHFDRFMKFLPEREAKEALMRVVDLVKRNLRSYDDAYYLDDGTFAMSLKQTTQVGAAKALARMKNELEDMNSVYSLDGIRTSLTLSSCVAEPVPENDVQDLVRGLMEQIKRTGEGDVVVQYQEVSPLQRFLQQTKGT
ncbi:MAG: GGDEF domain-containing protein, partial [Alphaproteobacteria bacterium]|nr:GGDEF domain-containing protein [Alphaproteobacteria bacterium]